MIKKNKDKLTAPEKAIQDGAISLQQCSQWDKSRDALSKLECFAGTPTTDSAYKLVARCEVVAGRDVFAPNVLNTEEFVPSGCDVVEPGSGTYMDSRGTQKEINKQQW